MIPDTIEVTLLLVNIYDISVIVGIPFRHKGSHEATFAYTPLPGYADNKVTTYEVRYFVDISLSVYQFHELYIKSPTKIRIIEDIHSKSEDKFYF